MERTPHNVRPHLYLGELTTYSFNLWTSYGPITVDKVHSDRESSKLRTSHQLRYSLCEGGMSVHCVKLLLSSLTWVSSDRLK